MTARISFTNKLFPSGALTGQAGSALMTGATGRLWANANGGRLELQSDAGDAQIVWDDTKVTVYDASSNTAYTADLPQTQGTGTTAHTAPTLDEITTFLTDLANHWTVSGAEPSNVAGEEAYTVSVSPSHDGGLLGSAQLAWDARNGTPLKIAVYAQGSSSPVLALEATDISFGSVPTRTSRSRRRRARRSSICRRRRPAVHPVERARRSPGSLPSRRPHRSPSSRRTRSSGCRARMCGSSVPLIPGRCSSSTGRDSARSSSSSARRTRRRRARRRHARRASVDLPRRCDGT